MVDLIFRAPLAEGAPALADDELELQPLDARDRNGRRLAEYVLDHGLSSLRQGRGTIRKIIVRLHPTLDDLLAASFVRRMLEGQPLGKAARAFAQYAGLAREGLRPSELSLDTSLEGIFLAILNLSGNDLSDPDVAKKFTAGWSRMSERILAAIDSDVDPVTTPLFAEGLEFGRERAFLLRDHEVFLQDVARGERWHVRIPGGPPSSAAVLLRQPKSLLFKYYCRSAEDAPGGSAFAFVAVHWQPGRWTFTTDPVHRLSLLDLHKQLQAAEASKDGERAIADPWFDGKPFDHTLVGSPNADSVLPDRTVLRIVKQWCSAQTVRKRRASLKAAFACAAAVLLGLGLVTFRTKTSGSTNPSRGPDLLVSEGDRKAPPAPCQRTDNALLIAIDDYGDRWPRLDNPIKDASDIRDVLVNQYGFNVKVVKNPKRSELYHVLKEYNQKQYGPQDQLLIFCAGHGDFDRSVGQGFLVAHDSLADESDHASCISQQQLRSMVENIKCPHIYLVLDVCFGGTIKLGDAIPKMRGRETEEVSKADYIARKMESRTLRYLTSCGDKPASDGLPGSNSPFAASFLKALYSGDGGDGIVTAGEIEDQVFKSCQKPQSGQLEGNDNGDFLFIRR